LFSQICDTGKDNEKEGYKNPNKAIMGPSMQQFFSSDVIATTCFDHTTIIKRQTVVYCRKWFA
jgi:hypothetical protein